jgi:hypothetical protein
MHLSRLGRSLKISSRYKSCSCIRNIPQQPFALLHYCAIGDLPSVASEASNKWNSDGARSGLWDYSTIASDWLTVVPFVACYPYQVLPPTQKQNGWLTQKSQTRETYFSTCLYVTYGPVLPTQYPLKFEQMLLRTLWFHSKFMTVIISHIELNYTWCKWR